MPYQVPVVVRARVKHDRRVRRAVDDERAVDVQLDMRRVDACTLRSHCPPAARTSTPGSIVSVAPAGTVVSPCRMYGLPGERPRVRRAWQVAAGDDRVGVGRAGRKRAIARTPRAIRDMYMGAETPTPVARIQPNNFGPGRRGLERERAAAHELAAALLLLADPLVVLDDQLAAREHVRRAAPTTFGPRTASSRRACAACLVPSTLSRFSDPTRRRRHRRRRRSCPSCRYRPKIFAGAVDVISTKRFIEILPCVHAFPQQVQARLDARHAVRDLREVVRGRAPSDPSCRTGSDRSRRPGGRSCAGRATGARGGASGAAAACTRSLAPFELVARVAAQIVLASRTGTAGRSRRRPAGRGRAPPSPARARAAPRGAPCRPGTFAISASAIARSVPVASATSGRVSA